MSNGWLRGMHLEAVLRNGFPQRWIAQSLFILAMLLAQRPALFAVVHQLWRKPRPKRQSYGYIDSNSHHIIVDVFVYFVGAVHWSPIPSDRPIELSWQLT